MDYNERTKSGSSDFQSRMLGRVAKVEIGVDSALLSGSARDFLLIKEVALLDPISSGPLPGLREKRDG
jgi:hypothetical protein